MTNVDRDHVGYEEYRFPDYILPPEVPDSWFERRTSHMSNTELFVTGLVDGLLLVLFVALVVLPLTTNFWICP